MMSGLRKSTEGTAALEFALIAPLFFLILFTMIAYGIYLSASHSIQQIAADAARTAVAGLSEPERKSLVQSFVATSALNYAFIDTAKLSTVVADDAGNHDQFTVTVRYDSRDLPIWTLFSFALPEKEIKRYATIRLGGL